MLYCCSRLSCTVSADHSDTSEDEPSHCHRQTLDQHLLASFMISCSLLHTSLSAPRVHLHVVGMLRVNVWRKPIELAHSFLKTFFLLCSCVYICFKGTFNWISFHKFSRQLSVFLLYSSCLISALLVLSTIHRLMKVSFVPDVILCGWLGLVNISYLEHKTNDWVRSKIDFLVTSSGDCH